MSSRRPAPTHSRLDALLAHPSHLPLVHVPRVAGVDAPMAAEQYAVYIAIAPSAARMADPRIQDAFLFNKAYGGLHVTVTGFARKMTDAGSGPQHAGNLTAVVDRGAADAARLSGWHPHSPRDLEGELRFGPGKHGVGIASEFLDRLSGYCTDAGLARVTPQGDFHVTVGDRANLAAVRAALLDRATTFTLCLAVRTGPNGDVYRYRAARQLWP